MPDTRTLRVLIADDEPLARQRIEDLLVRSPEPIAPYVNLHRLAATYQEYRNTGGATAAWMVWRTMTIALWLRQLERIPPPAETVG